MNDTIKVSELKDYCEMHLANADEWLLENDGDDVDEAERASFLGYKFILHQILCRFCQQAEGEG